MTNCWSDIARYNAESATTVEKISQTEEVLHQCQIEIPRLRNELAHHNYECKNKLYNLRLEGKIDVRRV